MLHIVQKTAPTPAQAMIERIKAMPRSPGVLQCARCGGRTVMTTHNGAWIDKNDRYHRGTIIKDRVCADCHRQGIHSEMMPDRPKLVK